MMKNMRLLFSFLLISVFIVMSGCSEQQANAGSMETSNSRSTLSESSDSEVVLTKDEDQEKIKRAREVQNAVESVKNDDSPTEEVKSGEGPKLVVPEQIHDYGKVGPRSRTQGKFLFKNEGKSTLKISRIQSTCGCTVPQLKKKEYAPGEEGQIDVTFSAGVREGVTTKNLFIHSNDPENPRFRLQIKAEVVLSVDYSPKTLNLSLLEDNAGLDVIEIKSKDDREFSITNIQDVRDAITIPFNPETKSTMFRLHPQANMEKLKKTPNGTLQIKLSHPETKEVSISYFAPSVFQVTPPRIILREAKPGETIVRDVSILSNYGEKFEIADIEVENGSMEVIEQQMIDDGKVAKLKVAVTPPQPEGNSRYFTDTMRIHLDSGFELEVRSSGWFKL